MKTIKLKIMLIMLLSCMFLLIIVQSFSIYSMYSQEQDVTKSTEQFIRRDYDKAIKEQVLNAVSLIKRADEFYAKEGKNIEERKLIAKELIRGIRYSKTGYFWIDTLKGVNVMHPIKPSIEGKNRMGAKDIKGKLLIKEIIENGMKDGGDFTDFYFTKPGEQTPSRKRGYSLLYKPFGWVIGTGNYIDHIDRTVQALNTRAEGYLEKTIVSSLIIFIAASGLAIVISVLFSSTISKPIAAVSEFIKKFAAGDLSAQVISKFTKRRDEIGVMIGEIDNFRTTLIDIVKNMTDLSQNLSAAAEQTASASDKFSAGSQKQAAAVEEINATIEEVSAGVATIHGNTKEQLASVGNLTNNVVSLNKIEERIKENVESISDLSDHISEKADAGNSALLTMKERFGEIADSSGQMLNVVSVITQIAEQINLLSLNASIESARAGEAGRGFAVVADEISKLADDTSSNVKNIEQNIVMNNDKIRQGEEIVNDSLDKLSVVIEGVRNIADQIKHVEKEIESQSETSGSVNSESDQVKRESDQIQIAIQELNAAMDEITSSISHINDTVQTTAGGAQEVASSSEVVASMAHKLQEKIEYFKLTSHLDEQADA